VRWATIAKTTSIENLPGVSPAVLAWYFKGIIHRWRNAMSDSGIFNTAVKLPADQRAAYLDQACGDNLALRREIESLLKAHEAPGSFLGNLGVEVAPTQDYPPIKEGAGTAIGPYKLLQKIGEGGMGIVYMADQVEPVRRKVALKIIKPGMDSSQVIARFEAERQALAMMDHQNIARALDAGTTESGRPYFVMELVHGVAITKFCDDMQLTLAERLALFVPVCQAIQHAHHKGIIHRDIKPSNVMVTMYDDKPVPKVIDFGVAKAIEQRLTEKTMFTQYGALVGTFEYMSPEQAEMNALGVDTRSDIYSLGVLLYELLTGTTPLERQRLREAALDELVRLIREEEPQRPSARLSSSNNLPKIAAARKTEPARLSRLVRGEIDWIVMRCLEKDRTRRYETANGLARDIEHFLHDEAVEACPPSTGYRMRMFTRKYRKPLAVAAAFAVLLVAATVVSAWQAVLASQARDVAAEERERAVHERETAVAAEMVAQDQRDQARKANEDLERNLYFNRVALAEREWSVDNVGRVEELLDECPIHLRGWEWQFLNGLRRREPLRIHVDANPVFSVVFSPDRRTLVSTSETGLVNLWDAETGKFKSSLKGHTDRVRGLAFSPDGERLATGGWDGELRLWNAKTSQIVRSFFGNKRRIWSVDFSPDGKRIASASGDGTLTVWDIGTGEAVLTKHVRSGGDLVTRAKFSPDGKFIATAGGLVQVWDASTGKELWSFEGYIPDSLAFTPDGAYLASGRINGVIGLCEMATGKEVLTLRGPGSYISAISFHPSGRYMASAHSDQSIRIWDLAHGREALAMREHTAEPTQVTFSRDGNRIASSGFDGLIVVRDASPLPDQEKERELLTYHGHDQVVFCAAFSPDGRHVATGSMDHTVQMWDAVSGKSSFIFRENEVWAMGVSFSPDGKLLAANCFLNLKVWDVETGKEVARLSQPGGGSFSFAWSPDGKELATTGSEPIVRIWNPKTGHERLVLHGHEGFVSAFAFSPDGKMLASGSSDRTVRLWDVQNGHVLRRVQGYARAVQGIAFSPDGKVLASVSQDGAIRIEEARTGNEIRTFHAHLGQAANVVFDKSGKLLAVCGGDGRHGEVRIFDWATGRLVHSIKGHSAQVRDVAFSPDGRRLVTASEDKTAKVWDVSSLGAAEGQGSKK
jgi:WD40 repeat protein/serine/threonine protein kinase